ncbi:MAG: hypothetical protein K9J17_09735 [Flavobacteriales bacterium]|nr:hypothetical protein [Flavobacteriales bacterium]
MKRFDNDLLNREMASMTVVSQLSVHKSRLYNALVNHVRLLRETREPGGNLWSIYHEGKLLVSLGLIDEAFNVVKAGIASAVNLEELDLEVLLRELLREILKNSDDALKGEQITENEYLLETAANKLLTSIKYTLINDRMFALNQKFRHSNDPSIIRGKEELINSEHLRNIHLADSLPSQLRFYRTLAGYYSSGNDTLRSLENYHKCLELWEANPGRIQMYPHMYLSILTNVLGKLIMLGRVNECPKYLERLANVVVSTRKDKVLKFIYLETQYHLYHLNTGGFQEAVEREERIEEGLRNFGLQVSESFRISIRYNIGIVALLSGNSRKALSWFNQIRGLGTLESRQDLQGMARLFRLLLLCEDDSVMNFSHFLRNSKRFFGKKHPSYTLETIVYSWLKKNHDKLFGLERKRLYQDLASEVQGLANSKVVGAEEVVYLAQSRATGSSISDLYRESLARRTNVT